ncbi:MAG: HNH endonuclease [Armatimonadetes bacterium]|nr:HNH endonuclease [Armatimonadota bacterium]
MRQTYAFRCGYCGITETETGTELTEDHFQPRRHGGTDDFANIVYCCHACNSYKGDCWNPSGDDRILHPLHDDVASHLQTDANGTITGTTPTGTFHVARLHLNRPPLIAYRTDRLAVYRNGLQIAALAEEVAIIRGLLSELLRGTASNG